MATMEKPKVEKKKKTKKPAKKEEKLLTDSEEEDESATTSTNQSKTHLGGQSLDIDFPTTKCDDIVSHECFVSANFQPFDKISLDDEDLLSDEDGQKVLPKETEETPSQKENKDTPNEEEKISQEEVTLSQPLESELEKEQAPEVSSPLNIPCAPIIEAGDSVLPSGTPQPWTHNFEEPTAPIFSETKTSTQFDFKPATNVKYPDLTNTSRTEAQTEVFYQTYKPSSAASAISRLKPFTTEQLREIYYCQDIEMVKQFELEFLMNSLLENTDNDPFYVFLLKYFNLQGKLVMNKSDLAEKTVRFEEAKENIWFQIEQTAKGSAMCSDGNAVYHTKTYEVAVINETQLALAVDALKQSSQLLSYSYTVNLIDADLTRIKSQKLNLFIVVFLLFMYYKVSYLFRYLINDTFTNGNPESPILFYCGNEANIEIFAKKTGFIWEFAPKINALIIFAEHRYYGKTLPFGNDSMVGRDHYGYLTIEQTLADFATLVAHLNKGLSKPRAAIAIGGSYGGILAALFRIKYQHLVGGALASSAPLKQFSDMTPCEKYSQIITSTFKNAYNEHCSSNIERSWTVLKDVAFSKNGVQFFNEVFGFCKPWKNAESVNDLTNQLNEMYSSMAMTNYPYETTVYTFLPAYPVRKFCSYLEKEYHGEELVKAFRGALNVYTNPKGDKKCFEFPEHKLMQDSDKSAWSFQRCSEIITGMCEVTKDNMFPPDGNNFNEMVKMCKSAYDIPVDRDVNRIKNHFGLDSLKTATNIIYSNGLLDPWSAAGVLRPPNDKSIVINIPEGAHHIDLRFSNEMDPPSVIYAREVEQLYSKKWIREF